MALVGQLHRLKVISFGVIELPCLAHHWNFDPAAVPALKVLIPGGSRVKVIAFRPQPLEIDGVSEQKAGAEQFRRKARGEAFRGNQDGDFAVRPVAGPAVDLAGGVLLAVRIGEVQRMQPGAVVGGQGVQIFGAKPVALLSPDGVGDVQHGAGGGFAGAWRRTDGGQFLIQGVECRMQPLRGQAKTERLRHLPRRLAGRPGVSHRQNQRYAVWRIEQIGVSVIGVQLVIEVKGEIVVAGHQVGALRCGRVGNCNAGLIRAEVPGRRGRNRRASREQRRQQYGGGQYQRAGWM